MATFRLKNLLRLKSRDSYTPKGSVDEIQCNESFLYGELRLSSSSKSIIYVEIEATGKRNLNAEKIRISLLQYVIGQGQIP